MPLEYEPTGPEHSCDRLRPSEGGHGHREAVLKHWMAYPEDSSCENALYDDFKYLLDLMHYGLSPSE